MSLSATQELQEEPEELHPEPVVSRSASLAKQIELDTFIRDIIRDNKWTGEANWRDRELEN